MQLAMEIPVPYLSTLSALTDVDYALAHLVLEDEEYRKFYAEQSKRKRRVVMDNSMHELKKPLNIGEVIEAAKLINPSVVIPPDKLGDAKFTYEGFESLRKDPRCNWDPGLVVQGAERSQRVELFTHGIKYSQTLFLPYREPRLAWLQELVSATPKYVKWPRNLHLLGVNTLDELDAFNGICDNLSWPTHRVCVDTSKPIKWGMQLQKIDELESLRGGGLLDLNAKLDMSQLACTYYNVAVLRKAMA